MKILLINPPRTYYPGSAPPTGGLSLGLLYIAAGLDKAGYEVKILDALIDGSPSRRQGDAEHVGMPWDKIREEVRQSQPDMVGITCPFSAQADDAVKVAQIVKEISPEIPVIVGGSHASAMPTQFLKEAGSIDIVVRGEGEQTMLDIVEHYLGTKEMPEIKGIAYRRDGELILNPARDFITYLDELPLPAYHLIDMEKYLNPGRLRYRAPKFVREIPMITSRGCPFNCVFCSIHLHMGKKWRAHSPEYVIAHIDYLINKYGVQHIHFEDDNLNLDPKRFEHILDGLSDKGLKITWDVPNGIRADKLSPRLLTKMKQTGCTKLTIGVESGDQAVLSGIIDKHLRLKDVVETAKICRRVGIELEAFYVIGFPGEKRENMERTIDFGLKLQKNYGVSMDVLVATPLYGTRLYEICRRGGYFARGLSARAFSEATQPWGRGLITTEDFTAEEVNRLALKALSYRTRFSLLRYLKHPKTTVKLVCEYPEEALRFLRRLVRI